jgi:hypothetical protein
MSDLNQYKIEQAAMFAIQDEFDQAEADGRIEDLAEGCAILFRAARKCGFDEDTVSKIAADLITKLRSDLIQTERTIGR